MICPYCGRQIPDNSQFCTECGNNLTAAVPPVGAVPPPPGYGQQPYAQQPNMSRYDGTVLDTFVAFLITSLITSFTCGIAFPWAMCYLYNFVLSHIIIDGKRLRFDGNGADLFANWIKWFVLTVITCGIYGFWVYPRLFDWVAKHTHYVN